MSDNYGNTQDAPARVKAADGKTTLHRFDVEAVIYAQSREDAQRRLNSAGTFLDHARIVPRVVRVEWEKK